MDVHGRRSDLCYGWVVVAGCFLSSFVVFGLSYSFGVFFEPILAEFGASRGATSMAFGVQMAAVYVGGVGNGALVDRPGLVRVFVTCSAMMGLATAALSGVETANGLRAFVVVYGLAYGGNGALLAPLTAHLFGREHINAVFGLVSVAFAVSGLAAPYLAGVGYAEFGTYDPMFVVAGGIAVAGAGAVGAADVLKR